MFVLKKLPCNIKITMIWLYYLLLVSKNLRCPDDWSSKPNDGRRDVEHVGAETIWLIKIMHYDMYNMIHCNTSKWWWNIQNTSNLTLGKAAGQCIARRGGQRQTWQTCRKQSFLNLGLSFSHNNSTEWKAYRSHKFFSFFFAVFLAVFFAICKKYR